MNQSQNDIKNEENMTILAFIDQILPKPTERKRPINCWKSKPSHDENDHPIPNHHYCSVKGLYLNKTEKAILILKHHKKHWLPLSELFIDDSLNETKVVVTIDIPSWLARKHDLAISYDPVTKKGKEFNQTIGFVGYGLHQRTTNTKGQICPRGH